MMRTIKTREQLFLFVLSMAIVMMLCIGIAMCAVWTIIQMSAMIGPMWTSVMWGSIPGTALVVRTMYQN